MFGNLVNKNARTALKEYGDHSGVLVDFDIVTQNSLENAHNPQYTAVAKLGERSFLPATASTKKDAKEYAADLALQALSQEPYGRFQQGTFTAQGGESEEPEQGLPTRYGRNFRNRRPKVKSLDPSAPPDKDPVMLLNEYGQKRDQPIKFEDVQCMYPGLYQAQVTVGETTFGPKKSSTKKMARKLVAIAALKTLMNWEPAEGLYNTTEESPHWSVGSSGSSAGQQMPGDKTQAEAVMLRKDPIMLLNEHCQRNHLKISYEDLPHLGPDHQKTFSCRVTVGERSFKEGSGATKVAAKKNAALHALEGLFNMPVELAHKPGAGSSGGGMTVERHPVSILNEYGQKKGVKVEFEDQGHTGPDHFRTYNFRAVVGDMVCDSGMGRSKKDAKREAAAIALKSLGYQVTSEPNKSNPVPVQKSLHEMEVPRTPLTDGKNSISALYELCQAYHFPQPEAQEVRPEGNLDPSYHYCAYKVGEELYNWGAGRTKKAAKESAAQYAVDSLLKLKGVHQLYNPGTTTEGDKIAALCWNHLSGLSREAPEGWRFAGYKVIAGFVMQDGDDDPWTVVSLGTGNKCISGDQLRMDGSTVNDSHAEVIARRSLIKFLHYHLTILLSGKTDVKSIFVQKERQGKIQLRDGIKFHLYVSTAPCGDAAIFVNETVSR
ncbi:double-stranded RNA-specific adenosine deaminase-like [Orbicella faveolata]|uniref:double-stranded RNA-specific adenosine deaminase-like n=1 Tax=Orbicella faveolata TaxID=48498 RepID=UPI0009E63381|nr:double-stranded RNA-specific adenosine deaminase-like [Orbicella faveolata]